MSEGMRVLIVNTSERMGGAAVAAGRLMEALCNNGVKAKMLVRDKTTDRLTVSTLPCRWRTRWHFLWERLIVWLHMHCRYDHVFEADIGNCGTDITRLPEFQEADIIHLHWVNQGMLSLQDIRRILDSGKRVVWTMHDMWPATGICHLTLGCRNFEQQCQECRLLPGGGSKHDLSARVWQRKQRMLSSRRITFVACSQWLADEARKSTLLQGQRIVNIPNPLDTHLYRPTDKRQAREAAGLPAEGRIILFVSQRATNPNKGMQYLTEACQLLAQEHPELTATTTVAVLGGHADEVTEQLPFKACPLGYVADERRIVTLYNTADVFVLPSLSENLPNTIMEAMACGVPCVGFHVGGIPEMIDHRENGYVAEYRNAADLAQGLYYVLAEADHEALSKACLHKVASCYSQSSVARQSLNEYQLP